MVSQLMHKLVARFR